MRIGFLFNHDQLHQIAHSLPIAIELARRGQCGNVVVLTGGAHLTAEVRRILQIRGAQIEVMELALKSRSTRMVAKGLNGLLPAEKLALYGENLEIFRALDILVVAEKTSTILKTRYGLDQLRIVHTRHGAGDRAIGFDGASRRFDQVLVAGETIRQRLVCEAGVPRDRIAVVGYPKFDLVDLDRPRLPMQSNGRPTVLYNPHVAPHLSSWYRHGRAVLDYFVRSDRYNLIFAPHVMLFHRPFAVTIDPPRVHFPGWISRRVRNASHIHVDLSGPACTDMTYTMAADIYLGDVSSQTYEFLLRPRPCVFLNSHGVAYEHDRNFAHWRAGRVIDNVDDLDGALREAVDDPSRLAVAQRNLFRSHIELTNERSSVRAARALERFAADASAESAVADLPLDRFPGSIGRGASTPALPVRVPIASSR